MAQIEVTGTIYGECHIPSLQISDSGLFDTSSTWEYLFVKLESTIENNSAKALCLFYFIVHRY